MIRVVFHPSFLKSVKLMPGPQQIKLVRLMELLKTDPYHPSLHTKNLTGEMLGILSFRITRDWRVIFQFVDETTIHLLHARHRKDVYRP